MDNNWKCYDFIEGGKGKIPALKTFITQTYLLGILKKKKKKVLVQTWNRRGNPWEDRKGEPDIYLGLYNWANSQENAVQIGEP